MGNSLNCWAGRTFLQYFQEKLCFFKTTGETPKSMLDILTDLERSSAKGAADHTIFQSHAVCSLVPLLSVIPFSLYVN